MACAHVIECERFVEGFAVAPDGQLLAIGTMGGFRWSGDILLLDAHSGASRSRLRMHANTQADTVAFSPASSASQPPLLLAAGFGDHSVRVWDCSSGACMAELQGHTSVIDCVTFSPDGRLLASASYDKTVQLWRTDDWHAPPAVLRGHADFVRGVAFSCDSRLLASCSVDCMVRLWHIPTAAAAAAAAAAHAAPAAIAAAGPVLDAKKSIYRVVFSPLGLLACGGVRGFLALAKVGAGDGTIAVERELQGHTDFVRRLAFSPCGRTLASASDDRTVRLWSVASGACLRVLRGHTDYIYAVAFFSNGRQLASGSLDTTARIWTVCAWSDKTHGLFGAPLKAAVFGLMCVRARLEQEQQEPQLPRLPMEVWLLVFGQLQLALEAAAAAAAAAADDDLDEDDND